MTKCSIPPAACVRTTRASPPGSNRPRPRSSRASAKRPTCATIGDHAMKIRLCPVVFAQSALLALPLGAGAPEVGSEKDAPTSRQNPRGTGVSMRQLTTRSTAFSSSHGITETADGPLAGCLSVASQSSFSNAGRARRLRHSRPDRIQMPPVWLVAGKREGWHRSEKGAILHAVHSIGTGINGTGLRCSREKSFWSIRPRRKSRLRWIARA